MFNPIYDYLDGSLSEKSEDKLSLSNSLSFGCWSGTNRIAAGWLFAVMMDNSLTVESCLSFNHFKVHEKQLKLSHVEIKKAQYYACLLEMMHRRNELE